MFREEKPGGTKAEDKRLVVHEAGHSFPRTEMVKETLEAADSRTARRLLANDRPDLALIDWMLPDASGLQWLRMLRREQRFRDLPVIMLTGHGSERAARAGIEEGAYDYLTKPCGFEDLLAKIEEAVSQQGSGQ